jgi:hypothetical protein
MICIYIFSVYVSIPFVYNFFWLSMQDLKKNSCLYGTPYGQRDLAQVDSKNQTSKTIKI